ncbi:MAG: aminotransferase class I/II-fold pyridoxal phosphate-dependent enzyme [Clostridia bacterium]|nr:aminotransferase class I/II-fold pyridoxal phosphate-dependent enzyme [Clostridia bacterium]
MATYIEMSQEQLQAEHDRLLAKYEALKAKGLQLDMSRGKPSTDQLNLSDEMLTNLHSIEDVFSDSGFDTRNYGVLDGLPECRRFFSDLLEVPFENIIIGGNASLRVMFDYITQCLMPNLLGDGWLASGKPVKFLCPCPGYDRHFAILEYYGVEMLPIDMEDDGPNIEQILEAIKDPQVKGMFCVPKYSNPTGCTYSDEKVRALAAMKPAAEDFRVIWDNAYLVHDLVEPEEGDKLLNIFPEAIKNGNEDLFVEVCSTSKVTFSGAGISAIAASEKNIAAIKHRMSKQFISNDKLNQLRHIRFLKDVPTLMAHMAKHRAIMAPKFAAVEDAFNEGFGACAIAKWTHPKGGYFINLDVMEGTAKRTVELCREAGVVLTGAGAPFPYGKDPKDSNIRVAPSFPPVEELKVCAEILVISAKLAATEKLLAN